MPMDLSRYPKNWKEISLRIREREGQKCKWCSAPNGQVIYRYSDGSWSLADEGLISDIICDEFDAHLVKVVLTVAHLGVARPDGSPGDKHDKFDVRDENLAALCQRCHLLYDLEDHKRNAAATRRKKKIAGGQTVMF